MKRLLIPFCLAGAVCADVAVDDRETVDLVVPNGAEQAPSIWFAVDAAKLEKSGPGTLTVSSIPTLSAKAKIAVREGAVNLVHGDPSEMPAPTAVLNRAFMWFDATKADSLVEGASPANTGVAAWYDVRETQDGTGAWGQRYYSAEAQKSWVTNEVSEGVWEKVVKYPVPKTYDTMPGVAYVDFNGRQSGSWMGFLTPGRTLQGSNLGNVRHVFYSGYVTGAWGFPLGSYGSPVWHPNNTAGTLSCMASANSASPTLYQGRSLWNGAIVDEAAQVVPAGPYVYEWDAGDIAGHFANFFNDRNLFSPYFRVGGDSLGEVVVFTNKLTTLEREQVSAYLLRKWRPAAKPAAYDVRLAKGASATLGSDAAGEFCGSGTLNLVDEGRTYSYSQKAAFEGQTRVASSVQIVDDQPRLALQAGDVYAVTRDGYDVLAFAKSSDAAKSAAGEAALALTASASVRVGEVPETVKKLSVSGAGELILSAPRPETSVSSYAGEVFATMPNADMEEWAAGGNSAKGFGAAGTTYDHWKLVSRTQQNYFLNMPVCRNVGHWTLDGGNKANFRWDDYVFQGSNVMLLKQGCVVENTVTFPADGDYEVTFLTGGRMDGSVNLYAGGWVKLSLIDGTGAENWFGTAFGYIGTSTRKQRFLVRGVKKGSYTFRLNHDVGTGDAHTILDDFKFRLVTDIPSETVVYPPNADFECVSMTWGGRLLRNAGNVAKDWTLTSSTSDPDVCLVTRGMQNAGYRSGSTRGGVQLAFYGPGGTATSAAFTLPAGTWKLRLRKAAFCNTEDVKFKVNSKQPNTASGIQAELLDGDTAKSFGATGASAAALMTRVTLPTAVTLAEPRTVRLRLKESVSQSSCLPCAMVDELELVRLDAGDELVVNGTFATESDWTLRTNRDYSTPTASNNTWRSSAHLWDPCRIAVNANAYGINYGVNTRALDICQCGSAEQEIAFPAAGTYRLLFSARSRLWYNTRDQVFPSRGWGGNQASFYLVDAAGVTNELFRTPSLYSSNFVFRSALFTVPAAGTYTFGIRGLNGMSLGNGTTLKVGYNAEDVELFVDQVSVKPVEDAGLGLDEKLVLDLKDTAKLRLDFTGTNEVQSLKLGGKSVVGYVDATHRSGLVLGTGCLFVRPRSTVMVFR